MDTLEFEPVAFFFFQLIFCVGDFPWNFETDFVGVFSAFLANMFGITLFIPTFVLAADGFYCLLVSGLTCYLTPRSIL